MECILHIAYNLSFKKWSARTQPEKDARADAKTRIQNAFRTQTGLIIDVPKQGSGNSNDGNTARRFFADPELTAGITGIDVNLITIFAFIYSLDAEKFGDYAFCIARSTQSGYICQLVLNGLPDCSSFHWTKKDWHIKD
jgi:hypothetical protein